MDMTVNIDSILEGLPELRSRFVGLRDLVLSNLVLIGEIPGAAVTREDDDEVDKVDYALRAKFFADRLVELGVDECSADDSGNPVGLVKGSDPTLGPIIVAAHLDSFIRGSEEIHFSIREGTIAGQGVLDNAVGAGTILSLPELLRELKISFKSDLYIVGFAGKGPRTDQVAVRRFLENLSVPVRGAVIVEGGELGRLNYYSEAMIRADVKVDVRDAGGLESKAGDNMVIVMNDLIDRILAIELPQKPPTRINIGRLKGGLKYGEPALSAEMGLEIRSYKDDEVERISVKLEDIVASARYEYGVDARLEKVASARAASIGYAHPLVKASVAVMEKLGIEPAVFSSESELSAFLEKGISAVTIGITRGEDYRLETARASIETIPDGLAQLIGIISAIDEGVCDHA
ncbi:hypothetical protein MASR2M78_28590 [Treponema sp.]